MNLAEPPPSGRLWLLGALTAVTVPQLVRLPIALSTICVLLLGWRYGVELRGWRLPSRALRLLLTGCGALAVLFVYHTLFGRDAGLALLTVMLCLKLLELRTVRDAMVTAFLGYFLLAGGFLYGQSLWVGIYLLAMAWLLTTTLVALNHPAGNRKCAGIYLRQGGMLLLQALPLMALLFVLFPRIPGPLWGLPKDAFGGHTGLSNHMTLANITQLADSEAVAFRVQFDGPVPAANELYWRGPVFWVTDGRRWDPLAAGQRGEWYRRPPPYTAYGKPVRYTLTLEPDNEKWLFALDLPASAPPHVRVTEDFQLRLPQRAAQRRRFALSSYLHYRAEAITPRERSLALQLPPRANPRTRALARSWDKLSDAEIVQQALDYFRNNPFYYTRRPPPLGDNAIDDFLFTTRRGFCEHYAAAFTTLMRAAGIPARVVTGYQGGEVNPIGGYMIVRQSMAHAWSEVYLKGRGWVRVDPTAVIPPQRVESTEDLQRFRSTAPIIPLNVELAWLAHLRDGLDALNNAWNQWVLGYNNIRQQRLLQRLGLLRFGWSGAAAVLAAAFAAVLGLVALQILVRGETTKDPLLRLYRRVERRLERLGLVRNPYEGPQTFARRIATLRPDIAPALSTITDLYVALRYGHGGMTELTRFRQAALRFRPSRRTTDSYVS